MVFSYWFLDEENQFTVYSLGKRKDGSEQEKRIEKKNGNERI